MARGRYGEKEKPDAKCVAWILAAISKVKGQKQRPSEDRISHVVETVYGLTKKEVLEQLELCVQMGKVIRVMNKGLASYKDPAALPRHARPSYKPPDFYSLVKEAIRNNTDENGCTFQTIERYLLKNHGNSVDPHDVAAQIKLVLKKGVSAQQFVKEGRIYRLPDKIKVLYVERLCIWCGRLGLGLVP